MVNAALGHALGLVGVDDFAGDAGVSKFGHGPRQGVHVDHELVAVPGAFGAGLDVGYEDVVVAEYQQVGLAGEDGGLAAEAEGVLTLDAGFVSALDPEVALLVEQLGVVGQPLGLVEVGGWLRPVLVMGLEPDGPLAGVLAGEQAR